MSNTNQNMNKNQDEKQNTEKLHRKIKQTWSGLGSNDIKLYDGNRDEFFTKLKEKHNISEDDAKKKMHEMEKECGISKIT